MHIQKENPNPHSNPTTGKMKHQSIFEGQKQVRQNID